MKKIRSSNFNTHLVDLGLAYYSKGPTQVRIICSNTIKDCSASIRPLYKQLIKANDTQLSKIMDKTLEDFI